MMLPTKFHVNWPFGSGEEVNNSFSRWPQPWRPSWISDRNDCNYFDVQLTPMLPTKFQVNWPFGLGGEAKNRFCFYLQVTPMLSTKFRVNWPFGSG